MANRTDHTPTIRTRFENGIAKYDEYSRAKWLREVKVAVELATLTLVYACGSGSGSQGMGDSSAPAANESDAAGSANVPIQDATTDRMGSSDAIRDTGLQTGDETAVEASTVNMAGGCAQDAALCSDAQTQTCDSDAQSGGPASCTAGQTCISGRCVGVVTTTAMSCGTSGPGLSNCGPVKESCCTSIAVPGGAFYRGYDGVNFTSMNAPATVSGFRLDKYEATVARFRQFVNAVAGGWLPPTGAGKHAHLNGGMGLVDGANSSNFESGWDVSWNTKLATTVGGWDSNLSSCGASLFTPTWTSSPGSNENRAIDCVTWYEAYAFCIWDDGFLPSDAEWQFVATGGSEQRVFPWSIPPTSTTLDCAHANYGGANAPATCCVSPDADACAPNDVGSESPSGDGKWGHIDLVGNAEEWNIDWAVAYGSSCNDCAALAPATARMGHGGGFTSSAVVVQNVRYTLGNPDLRRNYGVRCARIP